MTLTSDIACKTNSPFTSTEKIITVIPRPVAQINAGLSNFEIYDAKALSLTAVSSPATGLTYTWSTPDPNATLNTPTNNTTTGTVSATSTIFDLLVSNGACSATATVTVELKILVKIPTGFSPNNDGKHDTFEIPDLAFYKDATMTIFNQWGETVYKTGPGYTPWDGKRNGQDVSESTYYYILDFNTQGMSSKTGYITLIR